MRLVGKRALITAGASGVGLATARQFVEEGARVLIADIDGEAATARAEELGEPAEAVVCDVAISSQVRDAVDAAVAAFGGLDLMVNNAGIEGHGSLLDIPEKVWRRTLAVNLDGVYFGIRHAAPKIAEGGGGAIVNTASIAGQRAFPMNGAYCVSKAGVIHLTRCAALELRASNVRVNAIVPGMILTQAAEQRRPVLEEALGVDLDEFAAAQQGRWGTPEEVAEVAVHLASDEASFTSGHCYVLDNGYTAG